MLFEFDTFWERGKSVFSCEVHLVCQPQVRAGQKKKPDFVCLIYSYILLYLFCGFLFQDKGDKSWVGRKEGLSFWEELGEYNEIHYMECSNDKHCGKKIN